MTPVSWPDRVDEILDGDITAALAYVTPAGGTVVTAVAPVGLRDREAGTVSFTTSLGFGKKLERISGNPRVGLAYHARKHGFATGDGYVLVQGDADVTLEPDRAYLENELGPRAERFMGPPREGVFWDRWLREYYGDRVPVAVSAERVASWPDTALRGERETFGSGWPAEAPPPQAAPGKGTAPRVDAQRAARRVASLPYRLLGFVGADGYPMLVPVDIEGADERGIALRAAPGALPPGGRRAGLLAHDYGPQLVAIKARQHTGWLDVSEGGGELGVYAPHTERGFRAPGNKTLLLLANGLLAKQGLRRAQRQAKQRAGA
jgi:hypothetical protein